MKILQRIWLESILVISLVIGASPPIHPMIASAQDDLTWLVRLDLADQAVLSEFAQSRVEVFAQFYGEAGSISLLLPATSGALANFQQKGYTFHILEQLRSQDNLYVLYGLPETIQQSGKSLDLLFVEGRQAVARANVEQVAALESQGILLMPLTLYLLPIPHSSTNLAPNLPDSIEPNSTIQEMIDQVSSTALEDLIKDLTGERAATIDGTPYTIATRYTLTTTPINKATRYAFEYLQALGFNPDYDYYNFTIGRTAYERRNVIADQTGTSQPEKVYLLTAHLDSTSAIPMSNAPGADDNASGSAALLHIASILSQYDFACTLRYALFTGEEQGLLGSFDYANQMNESNVDIPAVINLDMVGFNTINSTPVIELHTRDFDYYPQDLAIANLFSDVIDVYSIDLVPNIIDDAISGSDHRRFWENGYPAILAIEDWTTGTTHDSTPYYHTINDKLSSLDMSYYTSYAKAALGTLAHLGCLEEEPCNTVTSPTFTFAPANPKIGATVTFTATINSGAAPISYAWDFGDGTAGSGEVVTHSYPSAGSFAVQLTADNSCNSPQSFTHTIFVGVDSFWLPVIFGWQSTP